MVSIKVEKREITGKAVKKLRKNGKVPAVLYGKEKKEELLELSLRDFQKIFKEAGESTLVELELGNDKRNVLIHDVSYDPTTSRPLHVDFLEVRMDKLITTSVPLIFDGESPAIKSLGGILVKVMHEMEIEALPKDLPHEIHIDISTLANIEDKLTVKDIKLPSGVKAISDVEETIVLIAPPR